MLTLAVLTSPSQPTHTQLASGPPSAFDVKVTNSLSMATVGGVDYAAYTATGKTYGETPPFPAYTAPCWHSDRLRSSFFVLRSLGDAID